MFKTVSKPLAHLNFLSGVNCYDIGSSYTVLLTLNISANIRLARKCQHTKLIFSILSIMFVK